jgi:hypothetical protein
VPNLHTRSLVVMVVKVVRFSEVVGVVGGRSSVGRCTRKRGGRRDERRRGGGGGGASPV